MHESRSRDHHPLDGLGVLRAVVEAGSFVRAGEALGLTQSAVSRAIARLEARVGVRMFRRSARAISLTDEGLRFYESVAPHLAAIEEATQAASDTKVQVSGRLRVNVDEGTAQYLLAPRIGPFLAQHPELMVELAIRDRMGDLVRDGFDVAVRFGIPTPSTLKSRLLLRSRILTCASPDYLRRHPAPEKPRDLEKHVGILMRDPATGAAFGWEFVRGKKTVTANVAGQLMVNGGGPLMAACVAGQGVAQLLELYTRPLLESGRLVQILPSWSDETYPLHAYYHAAPVVPAKVRAFLAFLVAITSEHAAQPAERTGRRVTRRT